MVWSQLMILLLIFGEGGLTCWWWSSWTACHLFIHTSNFPSLVLKLSLFNFFCYPVFCWVEKLLHLSGNLGLCIVGHLRSISWPWGHGCFASGPAEWWLPLIWWLPLVCIWFHLTNSSFILRRISLPFFLFFSSPSNLQNLMSGKFPYSFRRPGAAELIRESQLLMVQVSVECCVFIWGLQGKKQTGSEWRRVTC